MSETSTEKMLERVDGRLQAVEDQLAIIQLEAEYAVAWDFCEPERWSDCFTEDGVFAFPENGLTEDMQFKGHGELRKFCTHIKSEWLGLHFMHLPKITLKGDQATAVVFFEYKYIKRTKAGQSQLGSSPGYYEVVYKRTEAGWKIFHRIDKTVFMENQSYFEPLMIISKDVLG